MLASYVHGESAWHAHQGQRVVEYQQALQTVSDPLLGWATVDGRQYYVRQFRNMKGTIPLDTMDADTLTDYAGVVALLAKGHARTSGASMIAGYIGRSDRVADALCTFAARYADQTEADHAALVAAVDRGLPARSSTRRRGPPASGGHRTVHFGIILDDRGRIRSLARLEFRGERWPASTPCGRSA